MTNYNKTVDNFCNEQAMLSCEAGNYPKADFSRSKGVVSFSMFDFFDVVNLYIACYHRELPKAGILEGIYTKKREGSLLPILKEIASKVIVAKSCDLQIGQKIELTPIRNISNKPRTAVVVESIYQPGIFDVLIDRKNGYEDDQGSAYVWEIRILEVNGVWRPFDLTPEERLFKVQVEGR